MNRGRFLAEHLSASCAAYPDWGSRRRFRFRDMELTIAITQVKFGAPGVDLDAIKLSASSGGTIVKSYRLTVRARQVRASTRQAERSPYPEPPWFYTADCPAAT
jgi:hypothetical protein